MSNRSLILGIVINCILIVLAYFWAIWPDIQCSINSEWKPIIYLFPEKEQEVTIKVNHPENFNVTYPKYDKEWKVIAKPDGTLIDQSGRNYYSLYWESKQNKKNPIKEDGFVIKGEDTTKFLEEKLMILGLNEKEAQEFIIYWLPILEKNKYNYIRFQTMDEINSNMKLSINPKPDTLIRIRMEYKPLTKKIKVKEQKLKEIQRHGFTVVEWGGTNIN